MVLGWILAWGRLRTWLAHPSRPATPLLGVSAQGSRFQAETFKARGAGLRV